MLSVLGGLESFHYKETDGLGRTTFDKHDATLPTAQIAVDVTSPRSHLFARVGARLTDGSMQYVGALQDGTPLTGPTSGSTYDLEATLGAREHLGRYVMIGGFAGVIHRRWDRDLTPLGIAGYREEYSSTLSMVGARIDVAPTSRLRFSLEGSTELLFGYLSWSNLKVTRSTLFDDYDLRLDVQDGLKLGLSGAYAITDCIRIIASGGIDSFKILGSDRSAVTLHGQAIVDSSGTQIFATEPMSTTKRIAVNLGVAYAF